MSKEFEVTITRTEVFKVYVEANDWEMAENIASSSDYGEPVTEREEFDTEEI